MTSKAIRREPVLIANRGEIAIRIARSCKALGFPTVAVYSEVDRFSEHVKFCDQAFYIGGAEPKESYLRPDRILEAAKRARAKYVHPGYGFLSERPHFVEACEKAGIIFVGPSAQNMKIMGDKIEARKTVDALGVARVPGSAGAVASASEAAGFAKKVGYPVLLKAAAGGGGKGMRRVDSEGEIDAAFEGAARESLGAFGDESLYVEKYILEPHHVEIQVFGDGQGGAIHLGERECSIQRRHQKVWEESPSPILNLYPETRAQMFEAALKVTQHIRYAGAGTFEFIVDGKGNFYFLEMNTRLQVEHPVTEWVTGMDLVSLQLLLAAGELKLPAIPERRGSSIEVRVYAEDPQTFLPAPGAIGEIQAPSGAFVRWDSGFQQSGEVSIHYDPMIAKLSVWAADRETALDRLRVALDELRVEPTKTNRGVVIGSLRTNIGFLRKLVRNPMVIRGETATDLIPKNPDLTTVSEAKISTEAAIALAVFQNLQNTSSDPDAAKDSVNPWNLISRKEGVRGCP